jgi:hypothetical protein
MRCWANYNDHDKAFDSFAELNVIEQFGIAAPRAPIKNEPCLPFSSDIAWEKPK